MSRLSPSLLFPASATVLLAPGCIVAGGREIACDAAFGAQLWDGAVAALRGIEWPARRRITVVLSNHFVRYAVVPWSAALADAAEEQAYVRHHFVRIHGERAKSWVLRWSGEGGDAPRLASAIDAALLDALKASFPARGKARLASVQPALMALANRARPAVPRSGAWLVHAERGRACVARYAEGAWRSVQNAGGAWLDTLEREALRADANAPRLVLLAGERVSAPLSGWTVREVAA